jgi:hypothetical protein
VLRRSFEDVHPFTDLTAKGSGADFSVTWDGVKNNRALAAKGVAAVPFVFNREFREDLRFSPYVASITFAPSLRFEYLANSNRKLQAKNTEILTPGISGELELANFGAPGLAHYITGRSSVVVSKGEARNWQGRLEWLPIYNPPQGGTLCVNSPCPFFDLPLVWRLGPKAVVEYAGVIRADDSASEPLFRDGRRVLRAGGVLSFALLPNGFRLDELPVFLRALEYRLDYYVYQSLYSRRTYRLLDTVLTYNLDKDGNVAVALSFSRGNVEDTAERIDIAKLGLAVRF